MPRDVKIAVGILGAVVLFGLISLRGLKHRMESLSQTPATEEQARLEVMASPVSTPTDVKVKAQIFWLSASAPDSLAPAEVELALSAEAAQRGKQLLRELIADPPTPAQRTLPADTEILGFYVLPDGTAVADFSDALSVEVPSGILSEQLAVDSIRHTLESNIPGLRRLKILIHGQEVETLAGQVDLTGVFDLSPPASPQPPSSPAGETAPSAPESKAPGD